MRINIFRKPEISKNSVRLLIFFAFVFFILFHHACVFLGFYGMDDINYARYAAKVASGEGLHLMTHDHTELRWTTIYATAFFYKLFGINDYTSAAFGTITTIATGFIIFRLLKKSSIWVLTVALLLFFLDYYIVFTTHRIWPDPGVSLFILASYYFYMQAAAGKSISLSSFLFSACIFITMITKETVVLVLPLLVFLVIRDFRRNQLTRFWKLAFILMAIMFFGYILTFKIITNDWWYRYTVLQSNQYENGCSFDRMPAVETLKRIGYQLWQAFMLNGDLIVLIFGVCGFVYRKHVMVRKEFRDLSAAFFVLLLSSNFMTISYHAYVPLCQDPRHFIFLLPFAAVSGSFILQSYCLNPFRYPVLPVLFSAATICIFAFNGGEMKYIYLLINILLLIPIVIGASNKILYTKLFPFLIGACFLIRPLYDLYHNRFYYYNDHKKMISSDFKHQYANSLVLTGDYLTTELSEYFLKFNTGSVRFERLTDSTILASHQRKNIFFLINEAYNPNLEGQLKSILNTMPGSLQAVRKSGPVILYRVEDLPVLDSLNRYTKYSPM